MSVTGLKKAATTLLAMGIAFFLLANGHARAEELTQQEREYLRKKGVVTFISQTHYPPFEYLGVDGDHTGMTIELVRWIATRFGFKTRFIDTDFKHAQEAVLSGKADVITSLFYSKKRDQVFDFTRVIFRVPASIFVAADRPDIKRIEDLNGKIIAIQAGDYAQEFLEARNINFQVVWTKSFAEATDLVIAGKADAIIGDEQIVLYHIYSNNLTKFIKKVGPPLYTGQNCMAVRHGQHILRSILDKGITLAMRTGTLARINATWLGVHYQGKSFIGRYLTYFLSGAGLLVLLALLVWIWNIRLRSQVAKHTKALARSEETLKAILDKSPLGIGLIRNRVLCWHNKAMENMLGYEPGELDGRDATDLLQNPDELRRTNTAVSESLLHMEDAKVSARCVRKNGEIFDCMLHFAPLSRADTTMIVIAQDVSEQKQAAEALRKGEEQFRFLAESMTDIIWTTDLNFRSTYVSPSVEKMLGFTPEERKRQSLEEIITPESLKRVYETLARELRHDASQDDPDRSVKIEVEYYRKDGSTLWMESVVKTIRDADGNIIGLHGVSRDISDRKKAEEERDRLESQLRQAQKMEAIGTLAGGIAHDFNNILAAIMGYSELGLDAARLGKPTPNKHEQVLKAAERAKGLVQQILTFSREVAFELKPLDINREIANTVPIIERTIPKMISVELHLASDLHLVSGDANQIEQVLLNLASNAKDAMPDGGKLVIETANVTLDEEYVNNHLGATPGEYVLITVSDTGQGMDKESLEHIFEPFYTTKEVGKGTGLGLASVYGIVKSHHGYISCYSEIGIGTAFKIYLPMHQADGRPHETVKVDSDMPPQGNETVLLVDDDPSLREIGREVFTRNGYQIITAASGEEALNIYRERGRSIDLVVLDISMPGMGGYKCLQQLLEIDPDTKVVIASGYSRYGQMQDTLESGAVGYIAKPFKMAELLKIIREVLDA